EGSHDTSSEFDLACEHGNSSVLRNSQPGVEHGWVHAVHGEAFALGERPRGSPEEAKAHDEDACAFQKISAGDGFGFHVRLSSVRLSRLNLRRAGSRG